jgi:hypothetical protein
MEVQPFKLAISPLFLTTYRSTLLQLHVGSLTVHRFLGLQAIVVGLGEVTTRYAGTKQSEEY